MQRSSSRRLEMLLPTRLPTHHAIPASLLVLLLNQKILPCKLQTMAPAFPPRHSRTSSKNSSAHLAWRQLVLTEEKALAWGLRSPRASWTRTAVRSQRKAQSLRVAVQGSHWYFHARTSEHDREDPCFCRG